MSYIPAIDVSRWQGVIDWTKIGEPIAIIKISGGDGPGLYYDTQATHNYLGAKDASKLRGYYHFAGGGDPIAEADYFLRGMQPLEENDVMCLDWEIQHADPVGWCSHFATHIHDKTGVWPLLYINLATLNSFNWQPVLQNCGLWVADWNNDPDGAAVTSHTYVMQQYNDGPWCDHDAWFGTTDEFKAYGYHAPKEATNDVPQTAQPAAQAPAQEDKPAAPATTANETPVSQTTASPVQTVTQTSTATEATPSKVTVVTPTPTVVTHTVTAPAPKITSHSFVELLIALLKKLIGKR